MRKYTHIKNYSVFNGLDLRSSEQTRPRGFAKEALNVMRGPTGSLDTRWGHKHRADVIGSFGIWPYEATNMLQAAKSEIIGTGGNNVAYVHNLYRQETRTLTLTNGAAQPTATASLYWDTATSQFRFVLVRNAVTLLNQALGTGLESSYYTVASLVTAINAVANFTAAASGGTSQPAAFIDVIPDTTIAGGAAITANYAEWGSINKPQAFWLVASVITASDEMDVSIDDESGKYPNPFYDGDAVFFRGTLPAPLVADVVYYVKDRSAKYLKVAATPGGAQIDLTTTGGAFYIYAYGFNPSATFFNYAAEFGNDAFRPISSVQLRGCRYFASGRVVSGSIVGTAHFRESAGLSKYDGQSFYRAGLPPYRETANPSPGAQVTSASQTDCKGTFNRNVSGGGAPVFDHPYYDYQYKYIDKIGNTIEGALHGDYDSGTLYATPQTGAWSLHLYRGGYFPWLIARLGFNANYAIKNAGSTTSLTFTVTDGLGNSIHTMQVGDIAYFWDARQARFIQREVTARTTSTFTIAATSLDQDPTSLNYDDGLTPTVNPFAAFSANLRVVVWRSIGVGSAGAVKYLVAELPWNPIYGSYVDDSTDAQIQLNGTLVEKPYEASLPPPSRYLAIHNGQLISCGDDANPQTVSFEDIETPEGMPLGTHSFDLERPANGVASSSDVLVAGTDRKISIVTGDLSEFKFRVQTISDSLGIMSHESIREVEEGVMLFESTLGPYVLTGGRNLQPLGAMKYLDGRTASRVEPYFTADYSAATVRPAFNRAIGLVVPKDKLYILFVPMEDTSKAGFSVISAAVGTGSLAFVYDYGRGEWFRWAGMDYSACCMKDDVLHYVTRTYTGFVANTDWYLELGSRAGTMVRNKGKYSYSDHNLPLTWTYQAHWESLGRPSEFKRGLRCRISTDGLLVSGTPLTLKTYVNYSTALVSTNTVLTWAGESALLVKLNGEKCRSLMVEFGNSEYYKPFSLSGFELELTAQFAEVLKE